MAFEFFKPARGGSTGGVSTPIRLRIARDKTTRLQGAIRLSDEAMADARFIRGDKVLVGFDMDASSDKALMMCVKRVDKGGYTISSPDDKSTQGYIKLCCDDVFGLYPEGSVFTGSEPVVEGATIVIRLDLQP